MIKNRHCYYIVVAKIDQRVIGFATNEYTWGKLHLLDIAVEEKIRGHGIAREMILHLIEHARKRKVSEIYLEVLAKNKIALKLYNKGKFQRAIIYKNHTRGVIWIILSNYDSRMR